MGKAASELTLVIPSPYLTVILSEAKDLLSSGRAAPSCSEQALSDAERSALVLSDPEQIPRRFAPRDDRPRRRAPRLPLDSRHSSPDSRLPTELTYRGRRRRDQR